MRALLHALGEHRDALHADIEHYFPNRSILEWHRDEMPLIELQALFDWLPPESRTKTLLSGVTSGDRWTTAEWIAAQQLIMLQMVAKVGWVGGRLKGDPPKFGQVRFPTFETADEAAEKDREQTAYMAKVAELRKYRPTG